MVTSALTTSEPCSFGACSVYHAAYHQHNDGMVAYI